jgi:hypothetical protein
VHHAGQHCKSFADCFERLQVPFGIGEQPTPHLLDRAAMSHRTESIKQGHPAPHVVADIARSDERHACVAGHLPIPGQQCFVVPPPRNLGQSIEPVAKDVFPASEGGQCVATHFIRATRISCRSVQAFVRPCRSQRPKWHACQEPIRMSGHLIELQCALRSMPGSQQAAEVGIARSVLHPHDELTGASLLQTIAILLCADGRLPCDSLLGSSSDMPFCVACAPRLPQSKHRPRRRRWLHLKHRANDQRNTGCLGSTVRPHDPRKAHAIGDRESSVAQLRRPQHQLIRMRTALQK